MREGSMLDSALYKVRFKKHIVTAILTLHKFCFKIGTKILEHVSDEYKNFYSILLLAFAF